MSFSPPSSFTPCSQLSIYRDAFSRPKSGISDFDWKVAVADRRGNRPKAEMASIPAIAGMLAALRLVRRLVGEYGTDTRSESACQDWVRELRWLGCSAAHSGAAWPAIAEAGAEVRRQQPSLTGDSRIAISCAGGSGQTVRRMLSN